jgi:glycosyltransferase involved in cell wall biosynthesis
LGAFEEVVVVDSGSTDRTRDIAVRAGAKLLDFRWDGGFPKKRSWVLLNHAFSTPWVLFLDADETMTAEFVEELSRVLNNSPHVGFWLHYQNHFLGRQLRYGVPQRKLALFKVGAGLYEKTDEIGWSHLDMEVHEHPVLEGSTGQIKAALSHQDFRGLKHFIERHNSYSTWEANRYLHLKALPGRTRYFTPRQATKYRNLARWWFPLAYFLFAYVGRRGFLDGRAGFAYAIFKSYYFLQVREKIIEAMKANEH